MDLADSLDVDYTQSLFENFLTEFQENYTTKYLNTAVMLLYSEKNDFVINYDDVYCYNQELAVKIIEEFSNIYPFLKKAILKQIYKFAGYDDRKRLQNKVFYISFLNVPSLYTINQLTRYHIGTLIRVSGRVIKKPYEQCCLLKNAFVCGDCNTLNKDIDLNIVYDCPKVCCNAECGNVSNFIKNDEQIKVPLRLLKIKDRLSLDNEYKTLDVVVKTDMMKTVQKGGSYEFTGVLIGVVHAHSSAESDAAQRRGNAARRNIVFVVTGVQSKSREEDCRSTLFDLDKVIALSARLMPTIEAVS